jgi:hypothetical protein
METEKILLLVTLVAGVLQIILFFKLWAMTDDVRLLRNKMAAPSAESMEEEVRRAIVFGEKERAARIIVIAFIKKVRDADMSDAATMVKLKAKLSADLNKVGAKMPEVIEGLETPKEYYALFN